MTNRLFLLILISTFFLSGALGQSISWQKIYTSPVDTSILGISKTPNGRIFAGTQRRNLVSTNGGSSWSYTVGPSYGIATHPSGDLFGIGGTMWMPGMAHPAWRSTDNGFTWNTIPGQIALYSEDVTLSILPSGVIILGNNWLLNPGHYVGYTVSTSADMGTTRTRGFGAAENGPYSQPPLLVHNSVTIGTIALVSCRNGMFRSVDDGTTWSPSNTGLPPGIDVIKLAVNARGVVYTLVNALSGVYASWDSGKSWQSTGSGLPPVNTIDDIATNSSGDVFAGSNGYGVYRATSSTDSWSMVNDALTNGNVTALHVDNAGYLYAGTSNGDIFRSLGPTTGVESPVESRLLTSSLDQNYPNPFNPSTTIRYCLQNRGHVSLIVFNTLGQKIAVLQEGEREAGYHEVRLDGTNLASGVYFYRISAGAYVETRKLHLIR